MTSTFVVPRLPGSAIEFRGQSVTTIPPSSAETVLLPVVHDWGPIRTPVLCESFAEFESIFGTGNTPGRRSVMNAFRGEGLPGQGGAGGVIVYRLAGSAAAKATKTLQNATPAAAITLQAKYEGANGQLLSVTLTDSPRDTTLDLFKLFYGGIEVERYEYANTNVQDLADQINARSVWITANTPVTVSGVALGFVSSPSAFSGGNDGATLLTSDWSTALDAVEFSDFSIFAYDGVDPTVRALITSWIQGLVDAFRPVMLVFGGASAESVATAIARSAAVPLPVQPHVVNLGVGTFADDLTASNFSTALLAPRIAGIIAARGLKQSLTFADLAGLSVVGSDPGPSEDELYTLKLGGVVGIRRVSSPNTQMRIAEGVTTFTSTTDVNRPLEIFSEPRMVRVMDSFLRRMRLYTDEKIVGDTTVTDDARAAVRAAGREILDEFLRDGLILGDPESYIRTPVLSDPALLSAIPYEFGWMFARTTKFVIGHGAVR